MKKLIAFTLIVAACSSYADLAVVWKSRDNQIGNSAGTAAIGSGTYAALIWSAVSPTEQTDLNSQGVGTGEFLLTSTLTTAVGGGFTFNEGGSVSFMDDAVGNVDINNGYFFTRIFDTGTLANNNYYIQSQVEGPSLMDAEGTPPPTAKTYDYFVFDSGGGGLVDVQYVIPEPATVSMMAVAGIGMFLARRKKRR